MLAPPNPTGPPQGQPVLAIRGLGDGRRRARAP
jgi:hypothetical protein